MLIQYAIRSTTLLLGLLFSLSTFAAAVLESATGDVKVGPTTATASAASTGQAVPAGSTVVTGRGGRATLRFDDGNFVLLHEHTEFRIAEHVYAKEAPAKDKFVVELLRGMLRMVTAAVKPRNPQAYAIRTPQATIGIRGTDFMLASVNPLYISVLGGTVTASNAAGLVAFNAGATGFVANAGVLAASVSAATLPASVSAAFSQLGSIAIGAGGAVGASAAAAGGISVVPAAIAAGVAAGIAVSAGSDDLPAPATATATR